MAAQNGLMSSAQAQKLDAYPILNADSDTMITGSGTFVTRTFTFETIEGGTQLKWADGKVAVSMPATDASTETFVFETDAGGNLVYKRANGTTAFTIPLASGS